MSDKRELKEARELLVIRADHAGRLADEVRELEAERDGLRATIADAVQFIDSMDEARHAAYLWFLMTKTRGILTTSPTQSLANLQAALVLEYIDGPEHAESLRESNAAAWDEGVEAYRSRRERDVSLPLTNPYRKGANS